MRQALRPVLPSLTRSFALAMLLGSAVAAQAAPDCAAQAAEKKLHGAAKTSFVKKCEKDQPATSSASSACEAKAAEKKLHGAAKTSFVKKCVSDASTPAAAPTATSAAKP